MIGIERHREPEQPWIRARPAPWGAGAGEKPHDQPQIVAGDVDQVAFLDVVATTQPGSAHAAAVEGQREGALDDLGSELEGLLGNAGEQPAAVAVTAC